VLTRGGRALNELGPIPGYQPQPNSEYHGVKRGSESAGDKLRRQKGNSPDQQLRCPNTAKCKGGEISQTVRMLA
jgi:hypothetical protein